MAYEDIYKDPTEEERERMIKADILKFNVIGRRVLTLEKKKKGERHGFSARKNLYNG